MKKSLIIAPHGDDEVLGLGGYITSKIEEGDHVFVVYAAVGSSDTDLRRNEEIDSVVKFIGIQRTRILFQGYDGRLDQLSDIELISKLILQRDPAKSLWARPEVKRARRRTGVRREPFLPTTQSHGLCSRSQPKGVLKWVLGLLTSI